LAERLGCGLHPPVEAKDSVCCRSTNTDQGTAQFCSENRHRVPSTLRRSASLRDIVPAWSVFTEQGWSVLGERQHSRRSFRLMGMVDTAAEGTAAELAARAVWGSFGSREPNHRSQPSVSTGALASSRSVHVPPGNLAASVMLPLVAACAVVVAIQSILYAADVAAVPAYLVAVTAGVVVLTVMHRSRRR